MNNKITIMNDKITLKEAQDRIREIEKTILNLCCDFERETGLSINDIRIDKIQYTMTSRCCVSRVTAVNVLILI